MEPIFSDQVIVNGNTTTATLSATGELRCAGWSLNIDKQVLGFSVEQSKIHIRAVIETATGICYPCTKYKLIRKTFTLQPSSHDSLVIWTNKIQEYIDSLGRPKRLFAFVNPYGGKKSALKIFLNDVKPFLDDANISYTVQETQYRLHAKEVVQSLDLEGYDGIVCVSGDGILVEVLNGLLVREDWKNAIRIPLGVVPAGTGNGMAKSLLHSSGQPCLPSNATISIIQGHKCSLDVATVAQGHTKFFALLMLAWGLVADIDIESEKYRWMGSSRFDLYAIERIFKLRKYDGRLMFVPAPGYEDSGDPIDFEQHGAVNTANDAGYRGGAAVSGYGGPEVDLKSSTWRTIEGPFVSVWLQNVPWGSESTLAAPNAQFSDGYLDLILIKDIPKFALLKLLSQMNNGGHINSPYISYIKVRSFVLQPGRSDDNVNGGIIDVDGEVVARGSESVDENQAMRYDEMVINVEQGLATLFSPLHS